MNRAVAVLATGFVVAGCTSSLYNDNDYKRTSQYGAFSSALRIGQDISAFSPFQASAVIPGTRGAFCSYYPVARTGVIFVNNKVESWSQEACDDVLKQAGYSREVKPGATRDMTIRR